MDGLRLSPQQRRLWLTGGEQGAFRAQGALLIEGELRLDVLRQAVQDLTDRHEILRTAFQKPAWSKVPSQVIATEGAPVWEAADQETLPLEELFARERDLPLELTSPSPLRLRLRRLDTRSHLLDLSLPALCADAWTLNVLVAEIGRSYEHCSRGVPLDGEPPLQYADFAEWQNELAERDDDDARIAKAYWVRHDRPELREYTLPGEAGGRDEAGFSPRSVARVLPASLAADLAGLTSRWGVGLPSLLLATTRVWLSHLLGWTDLAVGRVFDGRSYEDLREGLGLFARCLPLRVPVDPGLSFAELAESVGEAENEARARQDHAPALERSLFPVIFEFEEWPSPHLADGLSCTLVARYVCLEPCRLKVSWSRGEALALDLHYDSRRFSRPDVERWAEQIERTLAAVAARPDAAIGGLSILGEAERNQLLVAFNDTGAGQPPGACFHRLFEAQARRTPERTALVFEGSRLTYSELNRQANGLACRLRALGVADGARIAVCLERSLEAVVAMLAVFKAGGVYVPLDPASPRERLAAMLEECGACALVGRQALAGALFVDADQLLSGPGAGDLDVEVPAEGLMYILFTSGSTGTPKGVAVEHRQLLHYLHGILEALDLPDDASYALVSTLAADLGHTVVFPALATGGSLHLISQERAGDPTAFAEYLARHPVDCLKIVPSHFEALATGRELESVLPRRRLVIGGEAARETLRHRLAERAPEGLVLHHYGPTEATVGAMTCRIERRHLSADRPLPLGRPLPGTRIYVLSPWLEPVPAGVPGELCIGGGGLARGYFGRPDTTAEKFIPDPLGNESGARLYRTGDLARFGPDGELEFLGRIDHQVKIHGYRIELGEIETVLGRYPGVLATVVAARPGRQGEKRLVAYTVSRPENRLAVGDLRQFLQQRLPDFMVPSAFVQLASLPLNANGKVDRRALPDPDEAQAEQEHAYVAPRDPVEALLVKVWSQTLGVEKVGIYDNFFSRGGDSILVIQTVARASQAGLSLSPKQLFDHQTIAELARVAGAARQTGAEQETVAGEIPLTPIQAWFFAQGFSEPGHWNQSLLFTSRIRLDPRWIEAVLERLLDHHDALRLRFEPTPTGWRQLNAERELARIFLAVDLGTLPAGECAAAIEVAAASAQASLDLAQGPLVRVLLFDLGPHEPQRLLIVVHHLAVDGVSWRILLDDLGAGYRQRTRGEAVRLPPKTTSFKAWAERLRERAASPALEAEAGYWRAVCGAPVAELAMDHPGGENTVRLERSVATALDDEETRALLHEAAAAYRMRVQEILLTALVQALASRTGRPALRLELEGHGREELFEDVDLSRTVGWFTTHMPVLLELPEGADPATALKTVKESLREIPQGGIGYGLLRWLRPGGAALEMQRPAIGFNYLGQLDQALSEDLPFGPAPESPGPTRARSGVRRCALDVVGRVIDGRLQMTWRYSEGLHDRSTIERLAAEYMAALQGLIRHCQSPGAGGVTPSDFPLAGIMPPVLDRILALGGHLEDLYPLSPLQQGLLFHTLRAPQSGFYVGQWSCILEGDLDVPTFEQAWRQVMDRHPILRTAFLWEGLDEPLQAVYQGIKPPIVLEDWREMPEPLRAEALETYLEEDRRRGFDPAAAPLMRLALFRLAERRYRLVWSRHHLLLDGWSVPLVLKEGILLYEHLRSGRAVQLEPVRPYRDYIAWVRGQDLSRSEAYWQRTFAGFTRRAPLGQPGPAAPGTKEGHDERWIRLPVEATASLQLLLLRYQLTMNTLVQGLWAILLSHHGGVDDAVFGAVSSGRPPGLPGIESMIGLFINTLPVRVRVPREAQWIPWLKELQSRQAEAREYDFTPLAQIKGWAQVPPGEELFESFVDFLNYPLPPSDAGPAGSLVIREGRYTIRETYPLVVTATTGPPLSLRIKYDRCRFDPAAIERMARHLDLLLEKVGSQSEARLGDLIAALDEHDRQERASRGQQLEEDLHRKLKQVKRKTLSA